MSDILDFALFEILSFGEVSFDSGEAFQKESLTLSFRIQELFIE